MARVLARSSKLSEVLYPQHLDTQVIVNMPRFIQVIQQMWEEHASLSLWRGDDCLDAIHTTQVEAMVAWSLE